jgi:hypothetical protein
MIQLCPVCHQVEVGTNFTICQSCLYLDIPKKDPSSIHFVGNPHKPYSDADKLYHGVANSDLTDILENVRDQEDR